VYATGLVAAGTLSAFRPEVAGSGLAWVVVGMLVPVGCDRWEVIARQRCERMAATRPSAGDDGRGVGEDRASPGHGECGHDGGIVRQRGLTASRRPVGARSTDSRTDSVTYPRPRRLGPAPRNGGGVVVADVSSRDAGGRRACAGTSARRGRRSTGSLLTARGGRCYHGLGDGQPFSVQPGGAKSWKRCSR